MQQLVGVEQRISRGELDRAVAVRFGLLGSEVGHFCFWGCFPWGVMVSSGSFSVVLLSGVFRLCVVRVILNGFLERLVRVIQWVSNGSVDRGSSFWVRRVRNCAFLFFACFSQSQNG